MVGASTRATDSDSVAWTKLIIVGLPVFSVALLGNAVLRSLAVQTGFGPIPLFGLPGLSIDAPLLPPLAAGGFDVGPWVRAWFRGLIHAGILVGYYLSWAAILIGFGFSVVGATMIRDPERFFSQARAAVHDRRFQAGVALQAVLWLVLFNPWLLAVAIELGVILVVGGSVFIIAGTTLLAISDRCGPVATVLVVHPLGGVALALPPIAAALVSPTFRTVARSFTTDVAVWLLIHLFRPIGLSRFLQQQFDLEGVGFVLLWTAVIVIVGWVIGGVRYSRGELTADEGTQ